MRERCREGGRRCGSSPFVHLIFPTNHTLLTWNGKKYLKMQIRIQFQFTDEKKEELKYKTRTKWEKKEKFSQRAANQIFHFSPFFPSTSSSPTNKLSNQLTHPFRCQWVALSDFESTRLQKKRKKNRMYRNYTHQSEKRSCFSCAPLNLTFASVYVLLGIWEKNSS